MKKILILGFLLCSSAFASLEQISAENLDLTYHYPSGAGEFEKLKIGVNLVSERFPITVERREDAFDILTPFVDFSWLRPAKFVHNLEALEVRRLTGSLGKGIEHFVEADFLMLRPEGRGEYKGHELSAKCSGGEASGPIENRLLEACMNHFELYIKSVVLSPDFILYKVLGDIFPAFDVADYNGELVRLNVNEGKYNLQVYIKYGIRAGLRASGLMEFQEERKVFAIRIDQVRFGYLPITNLVMKKLKEEIKSPNIEVAPPWIRIKLEE